MEEKQIPRKTEDCAQRLVGSVFLIDSNRGIDAASGCTKRGEGIVQRIYAAYFCISHRKRKGAVFSGAQVVDKQIPQLVVVRLNYQLHA